MWFKNLQIYRLPAPWNITLEALDEQLGRRRFMPCGSQDPESRGWVSPLGTDQLVHSVGGQWLIALGVEQRLLPPSVVRQVADERAEELAAQQGYKPGRKQMKELREAVQQELMPRAFTRRRKMYAWIDPVDGWLGVDAPSQTRAEDLLEVLRQTLDTLPLALVRTERSPVAAMADWLAGGDVPGNFSIDQDCELRSVADEKAAVRYVRHALDGDDVRAHLVAGKLPTRLALTFDNRVSFVLTEKTEIKRLDFLDVVKEQLDDKDTDAQVLFDAGFALMTGELRHLLPELVAVLGGELKAAAETTPVSGMAAAAGDPPF
jgi:recombination associated protein RdgC